MRRRFPALDPAAIDDIVLGVVTPVGDQGADIARAAALAAGLPDTVAGRADEPVLCLRARGREHRGDEGPLRLGGPRPRRRRRVDVPGADGLRRRRLARWTRRPPTPSASSRRASAPTSSPPSRASRRTTSTPTPSSRRTVPPKAWADGWFDRSVVPVRDRNGLAVLDRDEHLRAGATAGRPRRAEAVVRRHRRAGRLRRRGAAARTTGSSGSTTSTTRATPRASWTAPRWCSSAPEAGGRAAGLTPRARIVSAAVWRAPSRRSCSPARRPPPARRSPRPG